MDLAAAVIALTTVASAVVLIRLYQQSVSVTVVHDYEAGLLYRRGRFVRRLEPGRYRLLRSRAQVTVVDLRRRFVTVPGQEILSTDNVGLKISLALSYSVRNPEEAVHSVQDYVEALYTRAQLALRAAVAAVKVDELLERRFDLGKALLEQLQPEARALGLELHSADIKDVMFPGELKKIFAEVVRAQKEGQAALERARGETAALRNLANAARMLEDNPALLQLRVIQALSSPNGASNTVVFGVPQGIVPVPRETSPAAPAPSTGPEAG